MLKVENATVQAFEVMLTKKKRNDPLSRPRRFPLEVSVNNTNLHRVRVS